MDGGRGGGSKGGGSKGGGDGGGSGGGLAGGGLGGRNVKDTNSITESAPSSWRVMEPPSSNRNVAFVNVPGPTEAI